MYQTIDDSQKKRDEELRLQCVRESQCIEWIALVLAILSAASVIGLLALSLGGK